MSLGSSGSTLAGVIATAGGVTDAAGQAKIALLANALCQWIVDEASALPTGPVALQTIGTAVGVGGSIVFPGADGNDLGDAVANAMSVPLTDVEGRNRWRLFGTALVDHIEDSAEIKGTGPSEAMVANPAGGPVLGLGGLQFGSVIYFPPISSQMLMTGPNIVPWDAIGVAILFHIAAFAEVGIVAGGANGFNSPAGGGTLGGVSFIK